MKRPVVFWDVDTQKDFMDASGKLYVPEAEAIKPQLRRLTEYAHAHDITIVATADDHVPGHRELSAAPDYRDTFPDHCMRGTSGAEKIAETTLTDALVVEPDAVDHDRLAQRLHKHTGDVLIRKHWFDVFSNPNTETVIESLDPTEIVVYGVALDVCNKFAIEGFLERGVPQVYAVVDAAKPIHAQDAETLLRSWEKEGVKLVTTDDVVQGRVI